MCENLRLFKDRNRSHMIDIYLYTYLFIDLMCVFTQNAQMLYKKYIVADALNRLNVIFIHL